jgi:hypothetical protein
MKPKRSAILPSGYAPLLADLKARVRAAQVKAAHGPRSKLCNSPLQNLPIQCCYSL